MTGIKFFTRALSSASKQASETLIIKFHNGWPSLALQQNITPPPSFNGYYEAPIETVNELLKLADDWQEGARKADIPASSMLPSRVTEIHNTTAAAKYYIGASIITARRNQEALREEYNKNRPTKFATPIAITPNSHPQGTSACEEHRPSIIDSSRFHRKPNNPLDKSIIETAATARNNYGA